MLKKIDITDYAYTEGRGDALEGDVRVKRWGNNGDWAWTTTPWDSGRHPCYHTLFEYQEAMAK